MKRIFEVLAIGCSLPLIEAGSFKWNGNQGRNVGEYIPAQETGIGRNIQTLAMGPEPTSPAQLRKERSGLFADRRDTDDPPASVCGYLEGSSAYPYACAVTDSCLFTTISGTWVGGCCPTTSLDCNIATTCIDSSVWATLTSIGEHTYSCTYSDYPYCLTMTYDDLVGYTIMNCAATSQSTYEFIDYRPTTATSSSTSVAISSVVTSAANGDTSSTSTSSATSSSSEPATPASTSAGKSSLPIGAIAGGAVGGIAVIAILILGLVFICRRTRPRSENGVPNNGMQPGPPPMAGNAPNGGYPTQPTTMEQQWQQPPPAFQSGFGAADMDNRASIQKPPYDVKNSATSMYDPALPSPGSPPPPSHQGPSPGYQSGTVSPPLPQGQSQSTSPTDSGFQGSGAGANQSLQQHHTQPQPQQHSSGAYYELPSVRVDGELRELP